MSGITRRSFVGQSLAVAGAVTLASGASRPIAANDKMGIAIVGAGGRGGSHIGAWLKDSRTEILYVVDVDENAGNKRCDAIAGEQGKRPTFVTDMRRSFDDKSVDAISTATPNHWHALCGIWAMQAGKDAYIEKPICHDIAEGSALVAAAKKYKRVCQTGTQCRSNPAIQDAMKFIADGGIGECNFARGLCYKRRKSIGSLGDYPIPGGVDFDLWSGPAPFTDPKLTRGRFHYDWHWQRLYGNGDSGNQGPHQTDIARWGLGIDSHPVSVISYGGRLGYQAERKDDQYIDAGDTANTQVSIYDYGDKCIVFETRGLDVQMPEDDEISRLFQSSKGNKIGVIFYGSEGYLVQKTYTNCVAYDKDFNAIKTFGGGGNHFGNFLDVCESRNMEDLNADAWEGHLSAGLSHLGNISYYLGEENKVSPKQAADVLAGIKSLDDNEASLERTLQHLRDNKVDLDKSPISMGPLLKFDPEKEVFPESPAATEMVTRPYRDGFVCPTAANV
jgi:predicted dehydrogenase